MAGYTQQNRPLRVTTPLGLDVLLARGLSGTEALSELFAFRLDLIADKYVKIPFERLLGQSVTAEISHPTGVTRAINGIVRHFTQGESDELFTSYEAELAPRIWLLTQRINSRTFQQLSVPEILAKVLHGFKFSLELSGVYEPRDFCVQYRESDFAFISRLMEEEGISYYFRHQSDSHELVLTDATANLPDVADPATVIYEQVRGAIKENARIFAWKKSQQICPGKYTLWDHEFELPGKNFEATHHVPATLQVGKVTHQLPGTDQSLEVYAYPGEFAKRFDGVDPGGGDRSADLANIYTANKRTVGIRMQAGSSDAVTVAAASNCLNFLPGGKFTLQRHGDGDGSYLLTRVEHSVKQPNVFRSGKDGESLEYENRFQCVPASLPFRPQRTTPRPQIVGMQTATVVGPAGEQIFCDKYGRIKVQFHWDREGQNDAGSSCWIRVGQIWAGKRWGASFVPRVGHEVIVIFEDGDPDQPIVIGSVYNAANMPPFLLPDQKMVAGIKSCSVNGEPSKNFNGLVFHDELGNEHVQLHSERSEIHNSEAGRRERIQGSHVRMVGSLLGGLGGSSL